MHLELAKQIDFSDDNLIENSLATTFRVSSLRDQCSTGAEQFPSRQQFYWRNSFPEIYASALRLTGGFVFLRFLPCSKALATFKSLPSKSSFLTW